MIVCIDNIIPAGMLETLRAKISTAAFVDGSTTAGWHAKAVKNNAQSHGDIAARISTIVEERLNANPVFKAAAQPKAIIKTLLSKYNPGQAYGAHVDEPMMAGSRVDLSFTLFLSDPNTYEGGALIIQSPAGEDNYKLNAGSLVLYPTTALHRVEQVTSGERLVVVGWVRSLIREAQNRETIFDLDNLIESLRSTDADRTLIDQTLKIRANLMQKWIDD
jgi:PKHD-type hydroxylase